MDEVRRLRHEKGWSQNELAYHAKLAPSVISLIETGKRDPNATTLRKLAEALEVRIPDLFEESDPGKAQRRSSPPEPSLLYGLEDERRSYQPTGSEIKALGRWLTYLERRLDQSNLTLDELNHELDAAAAAGIRRAPAEYPAELSDRFLRLVWRALEEAKTFGALDTELAQLEADMNRQEEVHAQAQDRQE